MSINRPSARVRSIRASRPDGRSHRTRRRSLNAWIAATGSTALAIGVILLFPSVSLAAPPTSALRVESAGRADTLSATVGEPIKLRLHLPDKAGWEEANIGRFVIRTHGVQQRIAPTSAPGTDFVEFTVAEPGVAMIILAAGPSEEKGKSDSWQRTTHCTKLFLRVRGDGVDDAQALSFSHDPGQTAKVGLAIEVLPLVAPTALRVGYDLPVRVYFNNGSRKGVVVTAHRPDGSIERKTTDSVGSANFRITMPGRWIIRYEHVADGKTYVGDVVFEVPAGASAEGGER